MTWALALVCGVAGCSAIGFAIGVVGGRLLYGRWLWDDES